MRGAQHLQRGRDLFLDASPLSCAFFVEGVWYGTTHVVELLACVVQVDNKYVGVPLPVRVLLCVAIYVSLKK